MIQVAHALEPLVLAPVVLDMNAAKNYLKLHRYITNFASTGQQV